jgi:hypothetical protein
MVLFVLLLRTIDMAQTPQGSSDMVVAQAALPGMTAVCSGHSPSLP